MKGSLFVGKHVEPTRPVYPVDENLMRRIAEAKQRLVERNIEPVALLRIKPESHRPVLVRRAGGLRTGGLRFNVQRPSVRFDLHPTRPQAPRRSDEGRVALSGSIELSSLSVPAGVVLSP